VNELEAILAAHAEARERGEQMALATIIGVVGSAYRRAGARMLLTESGHSVGTISGGCLERDVAIRAAQVFETCAPLLIEYDTRGDEDIVWGLGLGCNGVVRILVESLHEGSAGERALQFISERLSERRRGVLATVVARENVGGKIVDECGGTGQRVEIDDRSVEGTERGVEGIARNVEDIERSIEDVGQSVGFGESVKIGERLRLDENFNVSEQAFNNAASIFGDNAFAAQLHEDASAISAGARTRTRVYETGGERIEIFFDVIESTRSLIVCGAEHDAVPVVHLAKLLGWHVTVVDTRAREGARERFASADEVVLCRAEKIAERVSLTENAAIVLMTHNYLDDLELLRTLLPSPGSYLGLLGSRERTSKLLEELSAELSVAGSALTNAQLARLHSPIGMDIGAETPDEIALAIIAEIKAVTAARGGGYLRDSDAPVDVENEQSLIEVGSKPFTTGRESVPLTTCPLS
jgi:xanthine/CO dehydrogenase XdhC/CoxF family maturation factor